jgi:curved DNA-binding protein CbpA
MWPLAFLLFFAFSFREVFLPTSLFTSATGQKHLPETMPGGLAVFDFDNDGLQDLYFTNTAPQPSLLKSTPAHHNRLFRNLGQAKFQDVTATAGVQGLGFDMGVAAADFDNDGLTDLFVASLNRNRLYRNLGNGKFQDVTKSAGLERANQPWAVGAGWFDMDNDGDLDLFVVHYVQWDPAIEPACGAPIRTYCHPRHYAPLPNALYRNNNDGTFTDVSAASGIAAHAGKGMGLAFGDLDGDHLLDVFVTKDTEPNFLFHNLGQGRFEEVAGPAGVAFNDDGRALSAMGADFRDFDNDGREDLFLTALTNETFPLFRNTGKVFQDLTYKSFVGKATLAFSGWSAGVFDFDNDGLKDLFAACADVQDNTEKFSGRSSRQPNLLLTNQGNLTFSPQTIGVPALHRGAAFGDLDNNGSIDIVVSRLNQSPVIYRNSAPPARNWLVVKLTGKSSNRSAIGALVEIALPGGRKQINRVTSAVGYSSSSALPVHFGLGPESKIERLTIRWPSGQIQTVSNPQAGRYLELVEP